MVTIYLHSTLICIYVNSPPLTNYVHFETDSLPLNSTLKSAVDTNNFMDLRWDRKNVWAQKNKHYSSSINIRSYKDCNSRNKD
jgi:hypothetical protein